MRSSTWRCRAEIAHASFWMMANAAAFGRLRLLCRKKKIMPCSRQHTVPDVWSLAPPLQRYAAAFAVIQRRLRYLRLQSPHARAGDYRWRKAFESNALAVPSPRFRTARCGLQASENRAGALRSALLGTFVTAQYDVERLALFLWVRRRMNAAVFATLEREPRKFPPHPAVTINSTGEA